MACPHAPSLQQMVGLFCLDVWISPSERNREVYADTMNHKMRPFQRIRIFLLGIGALLLPMQVLAGAYTCTAEIPAEVTVTGEAVPSGVDSKLVFVSGQEGNPMPELAEIEVKDHQTVNFGPITYTEPGDYTYRIYQEKGSVHEVSYDESVYSVTVRVVNDEKDGLRAEIWAVRDEDRNKTDKIRFTNHYEAPPKPEPEAQKTGDSMQPVFWGGIMLLSLLVMAGLRRRKG